MKKKILKGLKIVVLIILVILLIFFVIFAVQKIQEDKFKKILENNDSSNYELTEIVNGEEVKVYVRDKILLSEDKKTRTWVSELDSKRVICNDEYKTVIIDENDDELKVNSLNYTYINNFFENSNQKFKYLGEENGNYKLQFKEKDSGRITLLYINKETNIVEKMIQNSGKYEFVTEFKVEKDKVSKDEVAYPNLEGYRVYDSADSNPTE